MSSSPAAPIARSRTLRAIALGCAGLICALICAHRADAGSNKYHRERARIAAQQGQEREAPAPEAPAEEARPEVLIEVNIPATELTLYENGKPLFVKPIAIGQGVYPTPEQESHIKKIEWNPWWYPPPAEWAKNDKVTPPGPGNPLGLVKMPLSDAILFHGTNKEKSVGRPASHGCMRMFNADAVEMAWYLQSHFSEQKDPALRELYQKKGKQTFVVKLDPPVPVRLVYKPLVVKEGKLVFYPDYYRRLKGKKAAREAILAAIASSPDAPKEIDEEKVNELAAHWPPRGTEVPIASFAKATVEEPQPEKEKSTMQHRRPSRFRR